MNADMAAVLAEDEDLIHKAADGSHDYECDIAPERPCTCQVAVAQAAIRLLSVKHAWRGESDGDVGYDCDGRAMITFRADGDVEIYIPKASQSNGTEKGSR